MKKLLMLILSLSMATVALTSCNGFNELFESTPESSSSAPTSSVDIPEESETPSESTEDEKSEYTVTFQQAGQADVTMTVEEGSTIAEADIPTPVQEEGYTIVWKADELAQLTNISGNVTVTADKTANTYTITYNANGGTVASATQEVTYDSNVTLAVPTRDNYTFNNWTDANGKVITDGAWKIAGDVTLTANWTENGKAGITFVYADASTEAKEVYVNTALTDIPNPQAVSKTGYAVDANWYTDSACTTVADFTKVTENMTVYAKVTANTYTITYNANGGTVASTTQDVVYDSNVTLAVPTRDNYTFNNWKDGAGNVISNGKWTIASDVTLTANWTENEKVMVTFVYADGTTENSEYFYVGGSLTNIPATTKKLVTGYDIDENWYTDSTFTTVANFNNVSASMTVYAKKVEKTYTVQLNANGGTGAAASFNVKYGATVTLDVPSKTGYTFLGWYDGDTLVAKDTAITWTYDNANMTLTAKWQANTYTVTLNNGTTTTTMEVTFGAAYTLPTPTKEGFTFKGWTKDGIAFDAEGTWNYAMGATLVATWEENKESDGDWTQNY